MKNSLSLTFTGDLSFSGTFKNRVQQESEIFSAEVLLQMEQADFLVTNLEGPVSTAELIHKPGVDLRQPLNSISYINKRCNPVFNLSNNHIADCGTPGIRETLAKIESNDLLHLGADSSIDLIYLKSAEITIALISFSIAQNQHLNRLGFFTEKSMNQLKKRIKQAAANSDWLIISFHGGEEFSTFPSPFKRKLLRRIADMDEVDLIIAHHSHVFQGIETYQNTTIFYSLGNYVFDTPTQNLRAHTLESALVNFTFTKEEYSHNLFPIQIDPVMGLISKGNSETIDSINSRSDFTDYSKKWQGEAHRVVYGLNQSADSLKKMPVEKLVSEKNFYKRLRQILFDPENRSKYVSAVLYHLFQKRDRNR